MRKIALLLLSTLALAGCQSKAERVKQLQDQYNTEYPAYAKACLDTSLSGRAQCLWCRRLACPACGLEAYTTIAQSILRFHLVIRSQSSYQTAELQPPPDRLDRGRVFQTEAPVGPVAAHVQVEEPAGGQRSG